MKPQEVYSIHAYDLVTFVQEIEKAVKQGFEVDLHTINHYPQQLGYQFIMTLVKSAEKSSTGIEEVKLQVQVDTSQATAALAVLSEAVNKAEAEGVQETENLPPVEVSVEVEQTKEPAKRGPKKKV